MNKRLKKKYSFEFMVMRYMEIGRKARKNTTKIIEEGKELNYIEYDSIGLAFYSDEKHTYFKNIKRNDYEYGLDSKEYLNATFVLRGFRGQRHKFKNRNH